MLYGYAHISAGTETFMTEIGTNTRRFDCVVVYCQPNSYSIVFERNYELTLYLRGKQTC